MPGPRVSVQPIEILDQSPSQQIQMDVADQLFEIKIFLADDGFVSVLEQVSSSSMASVEIDDVARQHFCACLSTKECFLSCKGYGSGSASKPRRKYPWRRRRPTPPNDPGNLSDHRCSKKSFFFQCPCPSHDAERREHPILPILA